MINVYLENVCREDVGNNAVKILEAIFSCSGETQTLPQIRRNNYEDMARSNRKNI